MSAGGLSYSGLRTSAKVTLPSVEMWGTNMNILKDPSKSVYTRRIDKVGDTQSILEAQDESGDRICEMINVYARGVNPMVSVSYDNFSNNSGGGNVFGNQTNASLPYKVENVRPPVLRQEDLLPLSRLPRNWFYSYTNPSFPDLVQASSCNEAEKCIQQNLIHTSAFTNKGDSQKDDLTAIRDAPRSNISDLMPTISAQAPKAQPFRTSLREERDTGSEKKSVLLEKRDVLARTNPGGNHRGESAEKEFTSMDGRRVIEGREAITVHTPLSSSQQDGENGGFSSMDGGRIQDSVLHVPVQSSRFSNDRLAYNDNDFLTKDPKQIQLNKLAYNTFTNKGRETGGPSVDSVDLNKFINKDKYLCIARTNRTIENYQHPFRDADTNNIPTKDFLYKKVKTVPTSVFLKQDMDIDTVDLKSVIATPLHATGKSNLTGNKRVLLEHENLSREYRPNPSQPKNVRAGSSASIHVSKIADSMDGGRIHEDPLHYSAESARQMKGGAMPTDSSTTTFTMNPKLNVAAQAVKTQDIAPPYLDNAVLHRTLLSKTTGTATTNKTLIGGEKINDDHVLSHPMQDILVKSHNTQKTFMDLTLQDGTVRLENQKRTPIHSVTTNSQSPFSHTVMPEDLPHQRRRVLPIESAPNAIDPRQIEATGDIYSIQSRDSHQTQTMLPKGGFDGEGAGSAVPIFDRYGDREHVFSMTDQRDKIRQLVGSMVHDRHDSYPE